MRSSIPFSAMITDRPYAVARTPLEAANEAMDPRYDAGSCKDTGCGLRERSTWYKLVRKNRTEILLKKL